MDTSLAPPTGGAKHNSTHRLQDQACLVTASRSNVPLYDTCSLMMTLPSRTPVFWSQALPIWLKYRIVQWRVNGLPDKEQVGARHQGSQATFRCTIRTPPSRSHVFNLPHEGPRSHYVLPDPHASTRLEADQVPCSGIYRPQQSIRIVSLASVVPAPSLFLFLTPTLDVCAGRSIRTSP